MYHIELINDNDIRHFYYDGKQVEKGWPREPITQNLIPMSIPLRYMLISPLTALVAFHLPLSPFYFADQI